MQLDGSSRRAFLTLLGSVAASPIAAHAQQSAMPVIGYVSAGYLQSSLALIAAFRDGLKESGHIEGHNVAIETRWAEGQYERLPGLVAELIERRVTVIVAGSTPAAIAARQATRSIPIVFFSGADPVALGLVASLGRPGGNATGVSVLVAETTLKRLELLRELVPGARSIAFLFNPEGPTAPSQLRDMQEAIRAAGLDELLLGARTEAEIERAFVRLAERRPDALLVGSDSFLTNRRTQIVALAAQHAVPAIYDFPEFVTDGGLVSYGPNFMNIARMIGVYTGRILTGARPADLPVQQPTRFELVISLKTAKALGLVISPGVLARADALID